MRTLRLPDMVKKVSSMVKNQSVKTSITNNLLTISTEVWDFNFEYIPSLGYYNYDSIIINDTEKNDELSELKNRLIKEIMTSYGITNSL
jgi:hypothetical protein